MFAWMTELGGWAALITLSAMEIVLGIDNVVFISILISKLPAAQAQVARRIGLLLALVFRVALLFALTAVIASTTPLFTAFGRGFSWRDIVLVAGGLFLIAKATREIHGEIEGADGAAQSGPVPRALSTAILQIALIDLVFSIDSIITAIGMVGELSIMIAAVTIAIAAMYVAAGIVGRFIAAHPSIKMLALSFLILIGASLCAEGSGLHLPRGYIYSAMAFSAAVEAINIAAGRRRRSRRQRRGRAGKS